MAGCDKIIVSNVLCYLTNKIHNVAAKPLKTLMLEFYTAEELSDVKDSLLGDVEKLNLDKSLKVSRRRRDSVGKPALDLNDIFSVQTYLEENGHLRKLSTFCATSSDKMPSIRLVDGDLAII